MASFAQQCVATEGNQNPTLKCGYRGEIKRKAKSVVNFSFDTVFQDKWQLLPSQDSLLIIKDFLNYISKNMYLFFHFVYLPKPLSSKLWSAWVPVTMTSRVCFLFISSIHCCLRSTKVLAGSEARPAPTRVNSKGIHPSDFSSLQFHANKVSFYKVGFYSFGEWHQLL